MSFEARYRGKCTRCGETISAGDQVDYDDEYHRGNLFHANRCADQPDPDAPARNERRCPDCWTWHAGDCL